MIQPTELLLEQAERFLQGAMQLMPQPLLGNAETENEQTIEERLARLKICYLFPQFSDYQVQWLMVLYWQRQALLRLVNALRSDLQPTLRGAAERATCRIEQGYMALIAQVKALTVTTPMSAVQSAILEQEYFRIPFEEVG